MKPTLRKSFPIQPCFIISAIPEEDQVAQEADRGYQFRDETLPQVKALVERLYGVDGSSAEPQVFDVRFWHQGTASVGILYLDDAETVRRTVRKALPTEAARLWPAPYHLSLAYLQF